jgi:hypothetical protein
MRRQARPAHDAHPAAERGEQAIEAHVLVVVLGRVVAAHAADRERGARGPIHGEERREVDRAFEERQGSADPLGETGRRGDDLRGRAAARDAAQVLGEAIGLVGVVDHDHALGPREAHPVADAEVHAHEDERSAKGIEKASGAMRRIGSIAASCGAGLYSDHRFTLQNGCSRLHVAMVRCSEPPFISQRGFTRCTRGLVVSDGANTIAP